MKTHETHLCPLIVGGGRLARHFKHYLNLVKIPFLEWSRSSLVSFEDFCNEHSHKISSVYLLVSDASILEFYNQHKTKLSSDVTWCHASGALVMDQIYDVHPLMTFGFELYESHVYSAMTFVSSCNVADIKRDTFFGRLSNPMVRISSQNKAQYHALCVLAAAGTTTLWTRVSQQMSQLGVPASAIRCYQNQIFINSSSLSKDKITGPWVRFDQDTVSKNLESLIPQKSLYKLYQSLKGAFDELA